MGDPDAIRWLRLSPHEVLQLRAAIGEVLAGHQEVVAAYHYGSSVRGPHARDIDIGLVVDRAAMRGFDVAPIAAAIAVSTGLGVDDLDVRIVNEADAVFLGNLMRESVRCYQRDERSRVEFEVQAMNAWLDYQPVWDRVRARALETWSRG